MCDTHKSRGVLLQAADGGSPFSQSQSCRPYFTTTTIQSTNTAHGVEFLPLPCDFTCSQVSECQVWSSATAKLFPTAAGRLDARPAGLHSLLSVPWAGSRDPPTPALRDPTHRKRPPKPIQTPANIVCIECNLDLINTLRFVLYCHWRNWEQNQDSQWVLSNLPIQNPKPKLI